MLHSIHGGYPPILEGLGRNFPTRIDGNNIQLAICFFDSVHNLRCLEAGHIPQRKPFASENKQFHLKKRNLHEKSEIKLNVPQK